MLLGHTAKEPSITVYPEELEKKSSLGYLDCTIGRILLEPDSRSSHELQQRSKKIHHLYDVENNNVYLMGFL